MAADTGREPPGSPSDEPRRVAPEDAPRVPLADPSRVPSDEWVRRLADELGVSSPSQDEVDDLLALAGTAAHAAQRWVAPVSTWLVARAGLAPADARAAVDALAASLGGDD